MSWFIELIEKISNQVGASGATQTHRVREIWRLDFNTYSTASPVVNNSDIKPNILKYGDKITIRHIAGYKLDTDPDTPLSAYISAMTINNMSLGPLDYHIQKLEILLNDYTNIVFNGIGSVAGDVSCNDIKIKQSNRRKVIRLTAIRGKNYDLLQPMFGLDEIDTIRFLSEGITDDTFVLD